MTSSPPATGRGKAIRAGTTCTRVPRCTTGHRIWGLTRLTQGLGVAPRWRTCPPIAGGQQQQQSLIYSQPGGFTVNGMLSPPGNQSLLHPGLVRGDTPELDHGSHHHHPSPPASAPPAAAPRRSRGATTPTPTRTRRLQTTWSSSPNSSNSDGSNWASHRRTSAWLWGPYTGTSFLRRRSADLRRSS
ncbi:hypothetical protein SKAU_G00259200 [Synaphobranchus kaupii]|uniref:Uncharacterized protein n=1 Tax=Synaphobranchus kaupii TaxID=118154 RepID=A0A9Q1F4E0_SYNKA|nr:hypothetical protein SKAU_G00259200 [Synaphobranchus kaupii]